MSDVKTTDVLSHQDFDAALSQAEKRKGHPVEERSAPVVLSAEDLAVVAGGRRRGLEYEGQHR